MPAAKKDTIYIDIDDEITAVIEKVVKAEHSIAAVVLPKKATVFLSQVNVKLVKRAAEKAKKKLVFITSDKAIIAIASSAGVPTAATLTSKPVFPKEQSNIEPDALVVSLEEQPAETSQQKMTAKKDESQPAKTASSGAATTVTASATDESDAIELDNTVDDSADEVVSMADEKPKKSSKKLKIPDFTSFRIKLALAALAVVLLGVGWFVAFVVLPEAKVLVNADISNVTVDERVVLSIDAAAVDTDNQIIPAERAQVEKVNTATIPATGEKNIGQKATGLMNLENCIKSDGVQVIAAGTRFSAGSTTFLTTEQVILPEATFNFSGQCRSQENGDDKTVSVEAIEPGPSYNVDEQSYVSSISGINAYGGTMSGGTTEIVKVVSQEDIDQASAQLDGASRAEALSELQIQLQDLGVDPIDQTLLESEPNIVFSPGLDSEASEVKVTATSTYNMLGIKTDDLQAIIETSIKTTLEDAQQNIRDNGISKVEITVVDSSNNAEQVVQIRTVASVGPDLDLEALASEIAGLKRGQIESKLEAIDGVRSVSVEYSPGWVTTTPSDATKITIELIESDDQ